MDHPHNVLVCQTCGDYALSAKIRQSHTTHVKAEAIKDQATFLLAEELHHIATDVNKDEDIPTTQATTHGVGDDTAQSVEALAHINGLVIQPVPVCPINTASGYLKNIKRLLRIAYADHMIDFGPTEEIEGIKWNHTCKRERLTSKEIDAIKFAPFKDGEVKKAVRFDIASGLRRADLLSLRWENLEREKRRYYMCITIKKTGNKVRIPLSKEAVSILRPIRKKGAIFPTLSPYILNHKVPLLIEAAGIDKHITFHCFRHTFAMQLLDKGVDIPTIAFFLGHKFLGSSLTYLHCTKEHLEEVIAKLER